MQGGTKRSPKRFKAVPEGSRESQWCIKGSQGVSEAFQRVPWGYRRVPEGLRYASETFQEVPGGFSRVHKDLRDVSDLGGLQRVSGVFSSVVGDLKRVPGTFQGRFWESRGGGRGRFHRLFGEFQGICRVISGCLRVFQGSSGSLWGVLGGLRSTSRSQGVSRGLQGGVSEYREVSGVSGDAHG